MLRLVKVCVDYKNIAYSSKGVPWARFCSIQARWTPRRQLYRKTVELHISRTSLASDNISAAPLIHAISRRERVTNETLYTFLLESMEFERQTSALWQYFSLFYRKSRKFNNKAIFTRGVWRFTATINRWEEELVSSLSIWLKVLFTCVTCSRFEIFVEATDSQYFY